MSNDVTLLLTDVQGSTRLWEERPDLARAVIVEHHEVVARAVEDAGGTLVRERAEGDSTFAVFDDPLVAVRASMALQRGLASHPWPDGVVLRARAGLHSGRPQVRLGQLYGPVVIRAGAVRNLAHGEQIVLSREVVERVADSLPPGASLRPLGAHRLKGLRVVEEIWQLCHPDLPSEFPPLRSADVEATNLPREPSALIGRRDLVASVVDLLARHRIVTLTGAGGVGKSRVALAVARAGGARDGGVWFVDLSSAADAEAVARAVLDALGATSEPTGSPTDAIVARLGASDALLVLDDCERIARSVGALVATIARSCAGVRVLAASRVPLGVAGEHVHQVPALGSDASVALYRQRAADRGDPTADDRAVSALCSHLEGIPLAIEVAAASGARPADILDGVGAHETLEATLRATIGWSHDLLDDGEQTLLRRLSVFAGGFTLESAEGVTVDRALTVEQVLDRLARLVDVSLVTAVDLGVDVRYHLPRSVADHADQRLTTAGEAEAARNAHAQWFGALVDQHAGQERGPDALAALDLLDAENDNILTALRWQFGDGANSESGVSMVQRLAQYWSMRGSLNEAATWVDIALRASSTDFAAAELLVQAGYLAYRGSRIDDAWDRYSAAHERWSLALVNASGDDARLARLGRVEALTWLGEIARMRGDLATSRAHFEAGLSVRRELNSPAGVLQSLQQLGILAHMQSDLDGASRFLNEGLAICRDLKDSTGTASMLNLAAAVAHARGRYGRAADLFAESLQIARELQDGQQVAIALSNLAEIDILRGATGQAAARAEEAAALFEEAGDRTYLATALKVLGDATVEKAAALDRYARARELFSGAGAQLELADVMVAAARLTGSHADAAAAHDLFDRFGDDGGVARASSLLADIETDIDARRVNVMAALERSVGNGIARRDAFLAAANLLRSSSPALAEASRKAAERIRITLQNPPHDLNEETLDDELATRIKEHLGAL